MDAVEEECGCRFEALGLMGRVRDELVEKGEKHLLFPLLHMLERNWACIGEDIEDASSGGTGIQGVEEAVRRTVRYLIDVGVLPRLANGKGNDERAAQGGGMLQDRRGI